ncbi:MAG TPA: hypothetical protein VNM67_05170 [Thermoanaerobaculia bacterium]|nr:hypothetical protein [Thermoanaerobaculia bacterium]
MMSSGRKKIITAVAFSVLLVMSSGAQAGSLFALDGHRATVERQFGLFQQAMQWLNGTWTDIKLTFAGDEAPPPPPPAPCTNPNGCSTTAGPDGGWTIDPDG